VQTIPLTIPGSAHAYSIVVGRGLIANIAQLVDFDRFSGAFIVTDDNVAPHYLTQLTAALPITSGHIILPAGEASKTLESVGRVWAALHHAGCDRKTLMIALGGGVVGDLAGFAAATYMRGIRCLQMPTTVLSEVDSSIGGKTGFNLDGVKNLIGTFSQPTHVIIDVDTLATLPDREFVEGFGEIIKHGFISDAKYLKVVTSKRPREYSSDELAQIIAESCRIKARVVMSDETESGHRKLLNFGHTIGHAVEALSLKTDHPLLHGEAVSVGMVVEATISANQGLLAADGAARLKGLLHQAGLPVTVPPLDMAAMLAKMRSDKKTVGGVMHFTLLKELGEGVWDQKVSPADVEAAITQHQGGR
jgi:3-dehydroquinate synthase